MKKIIVLALFLALMVTGAFAMDRAVGGGFLFNASSTRGTMENFMLPEFGYLPSADWNMRRLGYGAFAFFGINQFVEFNLGFLYKNPNDFIVTAKGSTKTVDAGIESTAALHFGAYGKYPFLLSRSMVLFPTAGVDFEFTLSNDWWHDLWIRGGVGLDYFFSDTLFMRGHAIYGIGLPVSGDAELGLKLSHGLLAKIGLGWMF